APNLVLGPIQGIRHRDGTWTGTGPNYLFAEYSHSTQVPDPTYQFTINGESEATKTNFPATSATVTVLESGPLRAKVRVHYIGISTRAFSPPNVVWPSQTNAYYICDITLEAGQPVIHFDQESDHVPEWHVNMNTGMNADRARWRGHD